MREKHRAQKRISNYYCLPKVSTKITFTLFRSLLAIVNVERKKKITRVNHLFSTNFIRHFHISL
jgi:hypothetical protein